MKKIIILMLLCCCCIDTRAQEALTGNSVKTDSIKQNECKENVEQGPMLLFYRHILIENLEDEYDVIYDELSPREILASRGNKCYIVDIFTGNETAVDNKKDEARHVIPETHNNQRFDNEDD